MHEASLAEAALELVVSTARANGATKVTAINLAVGVMAEADAETLAFWIGIIAEGGPADKARVSVVEVPARATCRECRTEYPVEGPSWSTVCRGCGGTGDVTAGRELTVASIEVE